MNLIKKNYDAEAGEEKGGNAPVQLDPSQFVPKAEYDELAKKVDVLEKMVNAKTEINLSSKKDLPKTPTDPVEVNGKTYKFNFASFVNPINHLKILSEEAALDEDVLKAVVAIKGQGILTEVV